MNATLAVAYLGAKIGQGRRFHLVDASRPERTLCGIPAAPQDRWQSVGSVGDARLRCRSCLRANGGRWR